MRIFSYVTAVNNSVCWAGINITSIDINMELSCKYLHLFDDDNTIHYFQLLPPSALIDID